MPGDPPCWAHLFLNESDDMTVTAQGTTVPADLDAYFTKHDRRIHDELFEFLRIPSVSARSEHRADVRRAAEWLAAAMSSAGIPAALHETTGHPIVLGEQRGAGEAAPTILVYGHYDVQPVEP